MPRTSTYDRHALSALLAKQHGVIAHKQAMACGMGDRVARSRARHGGPWQAVLPGVYLTHTGTPTADQRDQAALLYAGPRSVLTGAAALRRHRMPGPSADVVDVLVPTAAGRRSIGFARLHRSARLPELVCVAGEVSYAPPARAVADAVRGMGDIREVRSIVAAAVQRGICSVELLAGELESGPVQGSAPLRQALAEVADGIRSTAEGDLRELVRRGRLPMPMFNPRLFVGPTFLAVPDCWWPQAGVAVEVDSREWHLSPRTWEAALARHARMSAQGLIVLHFTPRQTRFEREGVLAAIRAALESARGRTPPAIRTVPA